MDYIIKRDGRKVKFDETKIINAVIAAMEECDGSVDASLARNIADAIHDVETICTVEQIQDMVESMLMDSSRQDVAKAYILYRAERTKQRNMKSRFMQNIKEKITASNVQNQNANMDEASFGGRKGEAANELMREYALDYCMSDLSRNNHLNNEIYIHDLDSYAVGQHNCLSIPLDDLLEKGFTLRQTDIRPAGSINTAFQLVAVIFQVQSLQQFGGVSATHLDWTMVPYVRKSFTKHMKDGLKYCEKLSDYKCERFIKWLKHESPDGLLHYDHDELVGNKHPEAWAYAKAMTERELSQAVEGMFHNLNSLQSRSGNQLNISGC